MSTAIQEFYYKLRCIDRTERTLGDYEPYELRISPIDAKVRVLKDGDYAVAIDDKGAVISRSDEHYESIEEAINSLTDGRTWMETVLIRGDFTLSSPINLVSNLRLVILGKLTLDDNANVPILQATDINIPLVNCEIIGGILDGNASNQTSGFAIIRIDKPDYVKNLKIVGVSINNAYAHGIIIRENNPSEYRKIVKECSIYNIAVGTVGYGIYIDYAPNSIIKGNYVEPVAVVDGIEIGNSKAVVEGNILRGRAPINIPFAHRSIIKNNILVEGATIQNDGNNADNVVVEGNVIYRTQPAPMYAGIRIVGDSPVIADNYIYVLNDQLGISVIGDYARISDNIIIKDSSNIGTGCGIRVIGSSAVITGNRVYGFNNGIKFDNDYCRIENNHCDYCDYGIYITPYSESGHIISGSSVINNVLTNCTSAGIFWKYYESPDNIVKSNIGYVTENDGVATFSGDGTTTDFLIGEHGLDVSPSDPGMLLCYGVPLSTDAINASPLTVYPSDENADGHYESLRVKFTTAPISGTNNVKIKWYVELRP